MTKENITLNKTFNAVLGAAGTGKSYWLNNQIAANPNFAYVTSSTGVSALNIGGTTIHSALRYYDTASLFQQFQKGNLQKRLLEFAKKYQYLCIDEISMLPGEQLALICIAIEQINDAYDANFGLIILGDAAQLPTINAKNYFFQIKHFRRFDHNRLFIVKRQADQEFIRFLHGLRLGQVKDHLDWYQSKIGFSKSIDPNFIGTTILATNKRVDKFNQEALSKIYTPPITYKKIITGKPKSEWKLIPEEIELKPGCRVILTVNNHTEGYCNGDLATVRRCMGASVEVVLERNKKVLLIGFLQRKNIPPLKHHSIGMVQYIPLRLAYALTIHRTQGLTLNHLQCHVGEKFISRLSGGLYVLLSRIRDYRNLKVVGNKTQLIQANYVDPKIQKFLYAYAQIKKK